MLSFCILRFELLSHVLSYFKIVFTQKTVENFSFENFENEHGNIRKNMQL